MPRSSLLANTIGLTKENIETMLADRFQRAVDIVVPEFQRVLTQFDADSQSGAFTGYNVRIDITYNTVTKPGIGTLRVPQGHVYIESPDPNLNLFDLLDAGRPELPYRAAPNSPYPLWNLTDVRQISRPGERKRGPQGRFIISAPPSAIRGIRPAKLRYTLVGSKPMNAQYSPSAFTRGPISHLPPYHIYDRILNIAKKKLRQEGLNDVVSLIIAQRKKVG